MKERERPILILVAEDDEDDRLLIIRAAARSRLDADVRFVEDGAQLVEYLRQVGQRREDPRPDLILLDLNMPRKNGFEALAEIKGDSDLCSIPTVVLTTSDWREDVTRSLTAGANDYVIKPESLDGFALILDDLNDKWAVGPTTTGGEEK